MQLQDISEEVGAVGDPHGYGEFAEADPYVTTEEQYGEEYADIDDVDDGYASYAEDDPYFAESDYDDDAYGEEDEYYGEAGSYEDDYDDIEGYYAESPYYDDGYGDIEWVDDFGEIDPYYAEAEEYYDGYGYAEADEYDDGYGEDDLYYAAPGGYAGYIGDYAEDYVPEPVGYYADEYGYDGYGEYPLAAYAEDYDDLYGYVPEMVGYGEYDPYDEQYGDPDMGAYVRETAPSFNAGCPLPTNVAGLGEYYDELDGYVKPRSVNANCQQFAPQPRPPGGMPETFRPLW